MSKYYSADLSITIVEIKAKNHAQAERLMHEFIDKIAVIMDDVIRWDECDWKLQENTLDKKEEYWDETKQTEGVWKSE